MLAATALLLVLFGPQAIALAAPETDNIAPVQADQPSPAATQPSDNKPYVPKPCALVTNGEYKAVDIGVTAPRPLHEVLPKIPKMAKHQRFSAMAFVTLTVNASGKPENVQILRSAADKLDPSLRPAGLALDASAVSAVEQYRFAPAKCDGKSVPVKVNLEVNFQVY
jgi:TonB family protein